MSIVSGLTQYGTLVNDPHSVDVQDRASDLQVVINCRAVMAFWAHINVPKSLLCTKTVVTLSSKSFKGRFSDTGKRHVVTLDGAGHLIAKETDTGMWVEVDISKWMKQA